VDSVTLKRLENFSTETEFPSRCHACSQIPWRSQGHSAPAQKGKGNVFRVELELLCSSQFFRNEPFQEMIKRCLSLLGKALQRLPLFFSQANHYFVPWFRKLQGGGFSLRDIFGRVVAIPKDGCFGVIPERGYFIISLSHLFSSPFAVILLFVFIHSSGGNNINNAAAFMAGYHEQISTAIALAIDKIQSARSFSKNSLIITGLFDFLGSNCMLSDMLNIPFIPFKFGYMQLSLLLRIEPYFIRYLTKCQGEPQALKEMMY